MYICGEHSMAGLRGVKPSVIEQRLKLFMYGEAGAGKTTAAISFPKPYVIDCEGGTKQKKYVDKIEEQDGLLFKTTDFDELIAEVRTLLTVEHPYKTLVIDPLTILYNDLVNKCASILKSQSKEKDATGEEFGRHYSLANRKMAHLMSLLSRLDMNVIVTSQAKKEYGDNMKVIGITFDCYKKLDYLFDLVLEIQKRGKGNHVALVKKTRIEEFPDSEVIKFNYDEIAKRYGRDILEKDAVPEILASPEQVSETKRMVTLLSIPEETVNKWLTKANAETFEEMNAKSIDKVIEWLHKQFNGDSK
jgi:DNA-binding transcriptional regulator YdaS (Cro superfamily)